MSIEIPKNKDQKTLDEKKKKEMLFEIIKNDVNDINMYASDYGYFDYSKLAGKELEGKLKTTQTVSRGRVEKGGNRITCGAGAGNFDTKESVNNPDDYVKECKMFIEELDEKSEKEPESSERNKAIKNEIKDTLNGFAKGALEAGDIDFAKSVFKYTGYDKIILNKLKEKMIKSKE